MLDDQLQMAETPSRTSRLGPYWAPVLAYAALIYYLSSLSDPEYYAPILLKQLSDKVIHAVEYGIFGILCYRAFRYAAGARAARSAVLLAIVASTLYGVTDELHQVFVPLRQPDGWDLLMDLLGATAGAWSWHWTSERSDDAEPAT
jgi:VanZ family protein